MFITTASDHTALFNPFLAELGVPGDRPVHWRRDHVLWFGSGGAAYRVPLTYSDIAAWCRRREPSTLWRAWTEHRVGERYLVEHTSVNPVHPLHVGSLRGTLIGNSLAGLLRSAGADVEVRYFVNDLGRQAVIFGRVAGNVRWGCVPASVRLDHAVGVVYAAANMMLAKRSHDLQRLHRRHRWLLEVLDTTSDIPESGQPHRFLEPMLSLAADDMATVGATIDHFDFESDIDDDLHAVGTELAHTVDTVCVNGTSCLRARSGLVPLLRSDRSPLYFLRDVANTRMRATGRRILHVIGDDQVLLQSALAAAHPTWAIEHVSYGVVTHAGKRFSARQNRLTTVHELADAGPSRLWDTALMLLTRRRTRKIDLAGPDRRLARLVAAAHAQLTASPRPSPVGGAVDTAGLLDLATAILRTPAVMDHAIRRRAPHVSSMHLVEMSARYVCAARTGEIPSWLGDWFAHTHGLLARAHGLDLDSLARAHTQEQAA